MREVYRSNNTIFFRCISQVVWGPKYRRSVLVENMDTRLKEIIMQTCEDYQAIIQELGVLPDHGHLLVSVDPHFGMHRRVNVLKGRSSRLLRPQFPPLRSRRPSLWTNLYFVATVGSAPREIVKP
jgi:putative transposase